MSESRIKFFTYKCRCGYVVSVFVDFGIPQETITCRKCRGPVKRDAV